MKSPHNEASAQDRPIRLRLAEKADCRLIFEWRNHPRVRRFFFDPGVIPFEDHEQWFLDSLNRSDRVIFVAQEGDIPFGVIRFDMDAQRKSAEVDIYIDPHRQGQGLGTRLLDAGEQWIAENTNVEVLRARVMAENEASARMFEKCGFQPEFIQLVKALNREDP